MADFTDDREDASHIEQEVRRELDEAMRGGTRISEFTVDLPNHLNARPPLTKAQYEVAVTLNTLARLWMTGQRKRARHENRGGRASQTPARWCST